jgi:hypothetical protein
LVRIAILRQRRGTVHRHFDYGKRTAPHHCHLFGLALTGSLLFGSKPRIMGVSSMPMLGIRLESACQCESSCALRWEANLSTIIALFAYQ